MTSFVRPQYGKENKAIPRESKDSGNPVEKMQDAGSQNMSLELASVWERQNQVIRQGITDSGRLGEKMRCRERARRI